MAAQYLMPHQYHFVLSTSDGATKGHLTKLGNSTMRRGRGACCSNWKKVNIERIEKGFARCTKMDFMNLRNESTLRVSLVEISTENHIYRS
jgi:hypothetical protein